MSMLAYPAAALVLLAKDRPPAPDDVKAGWTAFIVFLLLAAAIVFLAFSLVKHLKRARANADRGVFDPSDAPRRPGPPGGGPDTSDGVRGDRDVDEEDRGGSDRP